MAVSPLPSWGPKRGRNHYATPAFSGVPNAKHGEEIRTSCLTPAFSGAQKWAEFYITPAFLGVPNAKRGEQNQKGVPHPCQLGVPKEGGITTQPLHSRGSPTPSTGKKSEMAVSPHFSGSQKKAELRNPCILGGPHRQW